MNQLSNETNKLIEENYYLVKKYHVQCVYRYSGYFSDDVIYDHMIDALIYTAKKYDIHNGASFLTFYINNLNRFFKDEIFKLIKSKKTPTIDGKQLEIKIDYVDEEEKYMTGKADNEEFRRMQQLIESDDTGILKMKADGYSQTEIANILNFNQSTISRKLNKFREELDWIDG